jgi:CO/xanthine dehydrogenase FAD-binding subunit
MDLGTVTAVDRPTNLREFAGFRAGDAWLAGGTWLFSEPQPRVQRLIDLSRTGWEPLKVDARGLTIAATCTIASLDAFEAPAGWLAAPLIGRCCRAFLASFKIWNMATVGGNLCMSLPAGPMISLCAALEGVCTIWTPDGGERQLAVVDFVQGPLENALRPGEVLRSIALPAEALSRPTAFRRASLSPHGRSGVLLIGTRSGLDEFILTVTASTRRPVRLVFAGVPSRSDLRKRLEAEIPQALYYDDIHGRPDWRRHMTLEFAGEICGELSEGRS